MSKSNALGVGSRILYGNDGLRGVVKFIGPAPLKEGYNGDWIGLCLDTPDGKNNGTSKGVEYFKAEENHGLFVTKWDNIKPENSAESEKKSKYTRQSSCKVCYSH